MKPIIICAALLAAIGSAGAAPRVERIATMRPIRVPQPFTATSGYVRVKTIRVRVRNPSPGPQGFICPCKHSP